MTELPDRAAQLWRDILAGNPVLEQRPDFREGGAPELAYAPMRDRLADLDARLRGLVRHPGVEALLDDGAEDAAELLHSLIALGAPVDARVSDFGSTHYLATYPEVAQAGVAPFSHYLQHGMAEGRITLRRLRDGLFPGSVPRREGRPRCLIALGATDESATARLALNLVRQAAATHDVTVAATNASSHLDRFREACCSVIVTPAPAQDFDALPAGVLDWLSLTLLVGTGATPFLRPLVDRDLPFAVYATEHTDEILPRWRALFPALFADLLVFPSEHVRASWSGLLADLGYDIGHDTLTLPPATLRPGGVKGENHANARRHLSHLLGLNIGARRLVVGAGVAHWRAGTDLFVMAAQAARSSDPDALFLWVGDGFDHESAAFGLWSDRHLREVGAGSGTNLHILPDGPVLADALAAADAFFHASRLDPLPTVAMEAVAQGCHVVAFSGASALSDPTHYGIDRLHCVPYGDIAAAGAALRAVPRKMPGDPAAPERDIFPVLAAALTERLASQRYFALGDGDFDVPILVSNRPAHAASRTRERRKVWTSRRRMVWPSADAARAELAASDSWVHRRISVSPFQWRAGDAPVPEFSLHLHAHHLGDLADDLAGYHAFRAARRLIVTTDTQGKAETIRRHLDRAKIDGEVFVMPNRGRDILPFLRLFWPSEGVSKVADDGLWAHVHLKKAIGTSPSGDIWRRFLMTILLGDATRLSSAVDLASQDGTGLIGAFDPYTSGWVGARRLLDSVTGLPAPLPERPLLFPMGNMFWAQGSAVTEMIRLFPPEYPWPAEPIGNDGTVYHLIERLWPSAAASLGLRSVFIEKRDQPRA